MIKPQEEINGKIEELLEEDEMDITGIKKPDIRCSHNHDTNTGKAQQKKQKEKKCKVLENKNAETEKQLEERVFNNS